MFYERFDENGIGTGRSNVQPEDLSGVVQVPVELENVARLRLENGVMRAETEAEFTAYLDELKKKNLVPKVITMRQYRLALLQTNYLEPVVATIAASADEALKIEWEFGTEVKRDSEVFLAMTSIVGMTEAIIDELFILGGTL
jgi:hypothetical protein